MQFNSLIRERGTKQFETGSISVVVPNWNSLGCGSWSITGARLPIAHLIFALKMHRRSTGARACTSLALHRPSGRRARPSLGKHWTAARASVFGGRCGWGAPTQQHEQLEQMGPAANGQGDDPSSSAPPLHMRLGKPAQRRHHSRRRGIRSLSTEYRTEHRPVSGSL